MRDYGVLKNQNSPYAELRSLDLRSVRWTRGFWADRFNLCYKVTLPHLYKLMADPEWGHALTNMRIAAGLEDGEFAGTHWQDAWVYKWLEAASAVWAMTEDEELERLMDETIDIVAKAQEPDGYIATQITLRGWDRFRDPRHHELYVMGHLLTAACIHHRVTGKSNLLDVARKAADYIWNTFKGRDPELAHFPLNPSIIMGAVELYRTTGDETYLDMANMFIDMRGSVPGGKDLNQDFVPLREENEAVGHGVFFTYLCAGAADVYMETGDGALLESLERLWRDLVETKMYINGGICAWHMGLYHRRNASPWSAQQVHEAIGHPYELPNSTAYNETCAQIGCTMWNWRMLLIDPQARYAEIMERQIYNSILSGIGLDGSSWFYTNVLRWYGEEHQLLSNDAYQRFQPGDPARRRANICCPTNLLRTVAEWHNYQYAISGEDLWVHHYGANRLDSERWKLKLDTDYPWDGEVTIRIESAPSEEATLSLRIPSWAEGAEVMINGASGDATVRPGSYVRIRRCWTAGDEVKLNLPMKAQLYEAHPKVEAARNQVAVMRGPILYCLESPDLPEGVGVSEIRIPWDAEFEERLESDLLGGVVVLECEALRVPVGDWAGKLYRPMLRDRAERIPIRLIPYFAWANRGMSEMTVWIPICGA